MSNINSPTKNIKLFIVLFLLPSIFKFDISTGIKKNSAAIAPNIAPSVLNIFTMAFASTSCGIPGLDTSFERISNDVTFKKYFMDGRCKENR